MLKTYLKVGILFLSTCPLALFGQTISTIAGNGVAALAGNGGLADTCSLHMPEGVAFDKNGNLFIADESNSCIRKVDHVTSIITNYAGTGTAGFSGDTGPASAAKLSTCSAIAFDTAGNLYIADYGNQRVRKVTPTGYISTVAGNGSIGFYGDGFAATNAKLYSPDGVALDNTGNLYIVDAQNHCIRKVDLSGNISTIAGTGGVSGFFGDGGPATAALLNRPEGIAIDKYNNIYVADFFNNRIRKIDAGGTITTFAGNGSTAYAGEGVIAAASSISSPSGVGVDTLGNVYFGEYTNERIRKVNTSGYMVTVAGSGTIGFSGDGGPATAAKLNGPTAVTANVYGEIVFSDMMNNRIRAISTLGTTFVNEITDLSSLRIFPNPTKGFLYVNADLSIYRNIHVVVYNSLGQPVLKKDNLELTGNNELLDLSKYPAGLYFVQLSTSGVIKTEKILKVD